ncbi:MAG TPA: L-alanine-DL-glutamate epimerase [Clostridiaceae bacterium]|nr:L-alanine-DL-glutamate epimerase [Clostridiaceae bacterium]
MHRTVKTGSNFEREPLIKPFGFKGSYLDELWQVSVYMEGQSGYRSVGLGTQSVLWSDADVFSSHSQAAGNCLMYLITDHALKIARNLSFENPIDLLDQLLPQVYEYGRKITCNPKLRATFVLNALVALDNAAWLLYCHENNIGNFDDMIPENIRPALSYRHDRLAGIPLITYGTSSQDIVNLVNSGSFFLKIKIGSDPEKDGDPEKMLGWDKKRLTSIHEILRDTSTQYTENGHIAYYLDANGRYDSKERLLRLLDHADKIGALDRIVILEEPFPEDYKADVHDIPVRLAADESVHSDTDATERIELGYRAIALKPIAKTMSMSLKICKAAFEKGIPCFCADLTVNPVLVDWNKNIAARLAPLPGMNVGVLESNGCQNYSRWDKLKSYHPYKGAEWIDCKSGLFMLNDDFYKESGGIFRTSKHYASLLK